ncbi:hypothetical protein CEXT_509621 [Caerostris extrusa]|uniref:Uncharacterized protein n=1 Tax=Caerostris extrusa TaxID=172846 RepID=A0AAV4PR21_CAEEX|nr:hypothetical protein CEXT_509621 [Caerostris extrusa]
MPVSPASLLGTPRHVCEGLFRFKIARPSAKAPFEFILSTIDECFHAHSRSTTGCSCREQNMGDSLGAWMGPNRTAFNNTIDKLSPATCLMHSVLKLLNNNWKICFKLTCILTL